MSARSAMTGSPLPMVPMMPVLATGCSYSIPRPFSLFLQCSDMCLENEKVNACLTHTTSDSSVP